MALYDAVVQLIHENHLGNVGSEQRAKTAFSQIWLKGTRTGREINKKMEERLEEDA